MAPVDVVAAWSVAMSCTWGVLLPLTPFRGYKLFLYGEAGQSAARLVVKVGFYVAAGVPRGSWSSEETHLL